MYPKGMRALGKLLKWLNVIVAIALAVSTVIGMYGMLFMENPPIDMSALGCNSFSFLIVGISTLSLFSTLAQGKAVVLGIGTLVLLGIFTWAIIRIIRRNKSGLLLLILFLDIIGSAFVIYAGLTQPIALGYAIRSAYLLYLLIYTCATRDKSLNKKPKKRKGSTKKEPKKHKGFFKNTLNGLDRNEVR